MKERKGRERMKEREKHKRAINETSGTKKMMKEEKTKNKRKA